MSLTFVFNRRPWAFLPAALLAFGCTRLNPEYCDGKTPCAGGKICDTSTNSCFVPDAALEPDAAPDTGPDLTPDRPADLGDAPNTCAVDDDCAGADAGPTCVRGSCRRCMGANDCKASLVCAQDTGRCVECTATEGCLDTPASPICVASKCVSCTLDREGCKARYPEAPVCDDTGACVECASDLNCNAAERPICNPQTKKCVPCTTDAQCAVKQNSPDPGVCLLHQGGRCATDAETIYVKNDPGCDMSPTTGGKAQRPYCYSQDGINAVTPTRRVVVLRGPDAVTAFSASLSGGEVTVIGQSKATIAPGAFVGIRLTSGELYLRGVTITEGFQAGVTVENGAVLRMNRCTVTNNKGGLMVADGGFDIANSVFAGNKGALIPNSGVTFGGVYLRAAPGKPAVFRNATVVNNEAIGVLCAVAYPVKSLLVHNHSVMDVVGCNATTSKIGGATPPAFDPLRPYRLTASSPCVNAGDPMDFPVDDIDGDPRPLPAGGLSDCGADEFAP